MRLLFGCIDSAYFGLVFVSDWRTRKAVQVSGTWVAAEWVLEVKGGGTQEPGLVMGGCPGHLWLHMGEWDVGKASG